MFVCKRFGFFAHRFRTSKNISRFSSGTIKTNFESAELLSALNNLTEWEPKYKQFLTSTQFLRLQQWKSDNGSLKTVEDLLKINGFNAESIKNLYVLCDPASIPEYVVPDESEMPPEFMEAYTSHEIDYGDTQDPIEDYSITKKTGWYTEQVNKYGGKLRFGIEPKGVEIYPKLIHSFTTIDQSLTGINWTKFSRYDPSGWMEGVRVDEGFIQNGRTALTEEHLCQKVLKLSPIINQIAVSDVYVMEANSKLNLRGARKTFAPKAALEIAELSQLNTIVTTILMNRAPTEEIDDTNVCFLGSNVVGKFFGTRLGNETVSSQPTVRNILKLEMRDMESDGFVIDISKNWRDLYFKSYANNKEGLGKSLLIGLTFLHLKLQK